MSPLRRVAESVKSNHAGGVKAGFSATGGVSTQETVGQGSATLAASASPAAGSLPAWAQRMRRGGHMGHALQATAHAVRSGDSHGSGASVNLSESDRT